MTSAVASLNDVSIWARSNLLEIVLYVCGAILLARFVNWLASQINERADARASESDALVRSEAAKHRHAVIQVLNWVTVVLIYCVTAIVVLQKLGIPLSGLVAPATVAGVALGFGAQRIVQDILAGFFLITERQYGFGDVVRISSLGSTTGVTGTVEDVTLRLTRLRSVNGEVIIVPNGQIVQVTNLSRDWARAVVDVPVPVSVGRRQGQRTAASGGPGGVRRREPASADARRAERDGRREPRDGPAERPAGRPHAARQAVRRRP